MARTTAVSRRSVVTKGKNKRNQKRRAPSSPVSPLDARERVVGANRRSIVLEDYVALRAMPKSRPWWLRLKVMVGLLIAISVIVAATCLTLILTYNSRHNAARDTLSAYSAPPPKPGRSPAQNNSSAPTNAGATEGVTIDVDKRPPPTDSSFLASHVDYRAGYREMSYRAAITLPENVSGDCVLSGASANELENCLLRHGGK